MKFKIITAVLSIASVFLTAGALAACSCSSHEHTFSETWSADAAYHWHAATCGDDEIIGMAAHTFDKGKETKPATHTTDGVKTFTCTVCGHTKTEPIPAKIGEHTFAETWTDDATDHWHVATCGHNVISGKAAHTFDDGIVTKPATHRTDGVKTFTCTVCGHIKTEPIPAKVDDHTFAETWTDDATGHWHEATCGHDVTTEKIAHIWGPGYDSKTKLWYDFCTDCGRKKDNYSVEPGTDAEHPVPIYTAEDFCSITSGKAPTGNTAAVVKYYRLMNDLTLGANNATVGETNSWGKAYVSRKTYDIELDGGGYKITSLTDAWLFDMLVRSVIKNLDVVAHTTLVAQSAIITMENVDVYGDMFWFGGNNAAYVIYAQQGVTLKNCTNYASITCTGDASSYNAVFVGYPLSTAAVPQTLKFENCKNAGTLVSGWAAMFVANASNSTNNSTNLVIENCGNTESGEVRATIEKSGGKINPFCAVGENNLGTITVDGVEKQVTDYDAVGGGFVNGPQDVMDLTENEDGTFAFNKSENENAAYYIVSVGLYTNWNLDGQSGSNRIYVTEKIVATEEVSYTSTLKNLGFVDAEWVENNPAAQKGELAGYATYTLDNKTYYLITAAGNNVGGNAKAASIFSVAAYDSDGKLISSVGL